MSGDPLAFQFFVADRLSECRWRSRDSAAWSARPGRRAVPSRAFDPEQGAIRIIEQLGAGSDHFARLFGSARPAISGPELAPHPLQALALSLAQGFDVGRGQPLEHSLPALYAVERSMLSCRPTCSKVAPRKHSSTTFRSALARREGRRSRRWSPPPPTRFIALRVEC